MHALLVYRSIPVVSVWVATGMASSGQLKVANVVEIVTTVYKPQLAYVHD